MYAAGSEKEKRAVGQLHGGTIAQVFGFCKGGLAGASDSGVRPPMGTDGFVLACAFHQRWGWVGVRPPSAEGLAWRAPFISGGIGLACALYQRGDWLGVRPPSAEGLAWRAPLSRPLHPPTFLETGGHPLYPRRGLRAPGTPLGGERRRRWRVGGLLTFGWV